MILGNPSFDNEIEAKGNNEYLVNHALVPKELVDRWNQICGSIIEVLAYSECHKAEQNISMLTRGLNAYNIYAHVCLNSTLTNKPKKETTVKKVDPCNTYYLTTYLNRADVQKVMHANTTNIPYPWSQCKGDIGMCYKATESSASTLPLLQELNGKDMRIMVYNGDWDYVVSVTSIMHVLKKLNLTVEKTWRSWFSEAQVRGYTEEYKGNFTYAAVRGAGHAVSHPIRALILFTSFIRNIPLPNL